MSNEIPVKLFEMATYRRFHFLYLTQELKDCDDFIDQVRLMVKGNLPGRIYLAVDGVMVGVGVNAPMGIDSKAPELVDWIANFTATRRLYVSMRMAEMVALWPDLDDIGGRADLAASSAAREKRPPNRLKRALQLIFGR